MDIYQYYRDETDILERVLNLRTEEALGSNKT